MKRYWLLICGLLLISSFTFAQTKHIGVWTEYVDIDGEYENILEALDEAPYDYVLHEFNDYTAITLDSLNSIDVFIVPECEMSGGYTAVALAGAALGPDLHTWVGSGGLLIGMFSHGKDFINAADFDSIGGSSTGTSGDALTVDLPSHPLADSVASTFSGMNASYAYSYYSTYTPVVICNYSGSDYMHTGFKEIGAGCVVYFGWDYYYDPTPNQDRLFQNAIGYWGARSEGPIMTSFFPPADYFVSADTPIVMVFDDEDGVELTSVQVHINSTLITGYSSEMSLSGDSLFIDLPDSTADGLIEVSIDQIEDVLGNEGPDTSRIYQFYLDTTPPSLDYYEPTGIIPYMPDGGMYNYSDLLSGTNQNNWYMYIEGSDTISNGTPGIICEGDSLILVAFSLAEITIIPEETTWVEMGLWDQPDIGEPNLSTFSWWFIAATDITERDLPENRDLTVWPNPFNSACRIYSPNNSQVEIFDISGNLVQTLSPSTENSIVWQPSSDICSGVYFIRIPTSTNRTLKRITYLK